MHNNKGGGNMNNKTILELDTMLINIREDYRAKEEDRLKAEYDRLEKFLCENKWNFPILLGGRWVDITS